MARQPNDYNEYPSVAASIEILSKPVFGDPQHVACLKKLRALEETGRFHWPGSVPVSPASKALDAPLLRET